MSLQAVDRARNVYRVWRPEVGRDLFGLLTLRATFGRTGTDWRTVTKLAENAAEARETARRLIARRRGAPRRAGVAYQVVEQIGFEGWDVRSSLAGTR